MNSFSVPGGGLVRCHSTTRIVLNERNLSSTEKDLKKAGLCLSRLMIFLGWSIVETDTSLEVEKISLNPCSVMDIISPSEGENPGSNPGRDTTP